MILSSKAMCLLWTVGALCYNARRAFGHVRKEGEMPRKIRTYNKATARKISRAEIVLWVVSAIVALSMVFGYIASAMAH